jgi:hypothetical protein
MKTPRLALLGLAAFLFLGTYSSLAGEIVGNCDSRSASRSDCITWVETHLTAVGCKVSGTRCVLHPWGSDFVKSWICTSTTSNCEAAERGACPSGLIHEFKDDWEVCRKFAKAPSSFHGECRRQNAKHWFDLKECDPKSFPCTHFGGVTESLRVRCGKGVLSSPLSLTDKPDCSLLTQRCAQVKGTLDQWSVSCRFRDMVLPFSGKDCTSIRARCERENSEKGPVGRLISCMAD